MNVLVIGGGAREHALVWKLSQSPRVKKLFCSPGNGGTAEAAVSVPACAENDWNSYADFVFARSIDLTVVGPEVPLAGGLADVLRKRGLRVFGPGAAGARLEGSKAHAKDFMRRHGIPTAGFAVFDDPSLAAAHVRGLKKGCVVKADGLAAGKGVAVCDVAEEALKAVEGMMVRKDFGRAGERVLVEERLEGEEFSLIALCDGKTILPLPYAKDYKRVFDGNRGANTGGMGAVSPCPPPDKAAKEIDDLIVRRFLKGIEADGVDYRGAIYFGLMLTPSGPKVLEFNVRFGDPETQVILPLIHGDLFELFRAAADGSLDEAAPPRFEGACAGVVLASGGYPGPFQKKKVITGLEDLPQGKDGVYVFHAGTVREGGRLLTDGGRVLNVAATGGGSPPEGLCRHPQDPVRRHALPRRYRRVQLLPLPIVPWRRRRNPAP